MATLYVRNFPEELYKLLKDTANEKRRSLSAEVTVLIERALQEEKLQSNHLQALERIAERRLRNPQPLGAEDTLSLLREDRSR